jgi:hypothetical protein
MPTQPLRALPNGSDAFIDANICIYGLNGQSLECRQLLDRCSREALAGIAAFTGLNEATHRFMLAEPCLWGSYQGKEQKTFGPILDAYPG